MLAHFIPQRHHHKKGSSAPSDAGKQLWCCTTLTVTSPGNEKGTRRGNWRVKGKESVKKSTAVTVLDYQWIWEYKCLVCMWAGWVKHWNKLYQDRKKIKWKAPPLESGEEEMEISTFPQQRAWEEMWEEKVLEVILHVNIGKNKVVIFSLIERYFNSFLFSSLLQFCFFSFYKIHCKPFQIPACVAEWGSTISRKSKARNWATVEWSSGLCLVADMGQMPPLQSLPNRGRNAKSGNML